MVSNKVFVGNCSVKFAFVTAPSISETSTILEEYFNT